MATNLSGTYLVRLFAAFESGLRSYWSSFKATVPPSKDLIDAIAARRSVPKDECDEVHEVRGYRNSLVHESDDEVERVEVSEARGRLCAFFSWLPDDWEPDPS